MFVLRSGLRFSFRALEVPEPRVRKRPLLPTNSDGDGGVTEENYEGEETGERE